MHEAIDPRHLICIFKSTINNQQSEIQNPLPTLQSALNTFLSEAGSLESKTQAQNHSLPQRPFDSASLRPSGQGFAIKSSSPALRDHRALR